MRTKDPARRTSLSRQGSRLGTQTPSHQSARGHVRTVFKILWGPNNLLVTCELRFKASGLLKTYKAWNLLEKRGPAPRNVREGRPRITRGLSQHDHRLLTYRSLHQGRRRNLMLLLSCGQEYVRIYKPSGRRPVRQQSPGFAAEGR